MVSYSLVIYTENTTNIEASKLEKIRRSLEQALIELAAEFHLDQSALLAELDSILSSSEISEQESFWKAIYEKLKAEALKKPDVLQKVKDFLIAKGYSAFAPINEEDATDVVIKKVHTYLFDKGTGALPRDAQAKLYYSVANKIFQAE